MEGYINSKTQVRPATPEDFSIIDELSAGEIPYTAQEYYNKVGDTERKTSTFVVIERTLGKKKRIDGWRFHQYHKNTKTLILIAGANRQNSNIGTDFFTWILDNYPEVEKYQLFLPGEKNASKRRWIKQSNSHLSNSRYEELFEYNR